MPQETKSCQNCKQNFTIAPEDFAFYEKMQVPPPTWCTDCRLVRRLVAYGKRVLYKRSCDLCGEVKFSMYAPEAPINVYCNDCWWSDKWDASAYAREFDFSRGFYDQYRELLAVVPWMMMGRHEPTMINSPYSNCATNLRNCYLVFFSDYVEDSYYCDTVDNSKDCFDIYMATHAEHCFESMSIIKCSRIFFSSDCEDSYDIYFSKNLIGCANCFGCVNLRKKQYYIFNEPYTKEAYFEKLKSFEFGSYEKLSAMKETFKQFSAGFPVKYIHGRHNEDATGDYVSNSKNAVNVFNSENLEDCKNCFIIYVGSSKDCMDYSFYGENASLIYESLKSGGNSSGLRFCNGCFPGCHNLTLCNYVLNSSDMFACVGLRNKQYCIFNKQYSKEEYEQLVPRIIQHMDKAPYVDAQGRVYKYGEFFPADLSPFPYNDSIAQEYFPLAKDTALSTGYKWRDTDARNYTSAIAPEKIPDNIQYVPDSICNEVIRCAHSNCNETCTIAFRIVPQELAFYRKMNFAIPRLCPNCRYYERLKHRNPLKLWHRKCMREGCSNEFETSYAPDRPEIVYCEQCYQQEVV